MEPGKPLDRCLGTIVMLWLPDMGEVTQAAGSQEFQSWFTGDNHPHWAQPVSIVGLASQFLSLGWSHWPCPTDSPRQTYLLCEGSLLQLSPVGSWH